MACKSSQPCCSLWLVRNLKSRGVKMVGLLICEDLQLQKRIVCTARTVLHNIPHGCFSSQSAEQWTRIATDPGMYTLGVISTSYMLLAQAAIRSP